MSLTQEEVTENGLMGELIDGREEYLDIPKVGDILSGSVIDKGRNAMYVDLGPLGVGVIYGRDLFDDMDTFQSASAGDVVEATVEKFDNEDNYIELSLEAASRERSWTELQRKLETGEIFESEILDANKGGLILRVAGVTAFLPVSQLAPEHYPRVEGGDKNKIFDRLKELVGEKFRVKVISAEQENEKLIVSEKAAISDEMSEVLEEIAINDVVSGTISGIVDFGVFVKFLVEDKELEGLVHISELAWQRIDNVEDFVTVGDEVKAKIIGIDGLRISLSIKQLQDDPWTKVTEKYSVGSSVDGEVLKVTPFGGFIKLDDDIHGLIHVSELPDDAQTEPGKLLEPGKTVSFRIISIEPEQHRLGLSLRDEDDINSGDAAEKDSTEDQTDVTETEVSSTEDADVDEA